MSQKLTAVYCICEFKQMFPDVSAYSVDPKGSYIIAIE